MTRNGHRPLYSITSSARARIDGGTARPSALAVLRLPEHQRQIVLLRDVDELTIDEIAQSLSLSREAVKGRLHLARRLIRKYLTG
jgi:DNA-directed RNA polymerase specialized sigma24 family protein